MMRYIQVFIQAAAVLFAANGFAQDCYLSTECDGDAICVNKTCAVPDGKQATCDSNDDCESEYFCESDVCKPDGVACQNDDGFGIENVTFGLAACEVGMQSKWMADMDCMPGADGCAIPSLDQMTTAELEDEYQDCMTHLEDACDIDVPNPEDVCDSDWLDTCTDYVTRIEDFQSVCAEDKGMGGGDDSVSVSNLYSLPKMYGLTAEQTDFHIGLCCEDFKDNSDWDYLEAVVDCMDGLSSDDCDGALACNDITPNGDGTFGKDDNADDVADDNDEENENSPSASSQSGGANDSGCSLVHPATPPGTLLGLLLI